MGVVLAGSGLTVADVVAVARDRARVELAPEVLDAMGRARGVAERAREGGEPVYGLTTGVGVRKGARVEAEGHDRVLLAQHLIGQGPSAPRDVVRATTLCLLAGLARASTAARPELALHVAKALNEDRLPEIHTLGSVGQADLAQMADLATGLISGEDGMPAAGEGIALLNRNAFATGWGALAVADAVALLDALDVSAALSFEGFAASRSVLDSAVAETRRSEGLAAALRRLRSLLDGSSIETRSLQDPLSFRTVPQLHGAARDALAYVVHAVEVELDASQSNPLVVAAEDRIVSVGSFESAALATALDLARLAVAPVLTSATERSLKLLQASQTGLPEGLGARAGLAESALSEFGIAAQAIAAEARLLAAPVSLELVSTTQAEGLEDRMSLAPLSARRLAEMTGLGHRVVALELLLAAQACDLRSAGLGAGTAQVHAAVRRLVPFVGEGDALPDVEPLVALVAARGLTS